MAPHTACWAVCDRTLIKIFYRAACWTVCAKNDTDRLTTDHDFYRGCAEPYAKIDIKIITGNWSTDHWSWFLPRSVLSRMQRTILKSLAGIRSTDHWLWFFTVQRAEQHAKNNIKNTVGELIDWPLIMTFYCATWWTVCAKNVFKNITRELINRPLIKIFYRGACWTVCAKNDIKNIAGELINWSTDHWSWFFTAQLGCMREEWY